MKRVIVVLFLPMFILINGYGQSLNDLDIKNGFRHFKFGTPPSQIKNIVKVPGLLEYPNAVYYKYVGSDIDYVYGIKVDKIELMFFNNKLCHIMIFFDDCKESEYYGLLRVFEEVYGENWVKLTSGSKDEVMLNGASWEGKNVRLDFYRSRMRGVVGGYIEIFDKKLLTAMYASEF